MTSLAYGEGAAMLKNPGLSLERSCAMRRASTEEEQAAFVRVFGRWIRGYPSIAPTLGVGT